MHIHPFPHTRPRGLLVAALALLAALAIPAAAQAGSGSRVDAKRDAPRHADLLRASAGYKSGAGKLNASFKLADYRAAAGKRHVVGVYFAKRQGKRCLTTDGSAISLETDTKLAQAAETGSTAPVKAKAVVKGNSVKLSVRGGEFAGKPYDCVVVTTIARPTSGDVGTILDRVDLKLK